MTIEISYKATCAVCGAVKEGTGAELSEASWRMTQGGREALPADAWETNVVADDCICPDCAAEYETLAKAAEEAQQAAYDALGKFTPTPSPSGGSGTEDDPYTFETGVTCVLNAFYTHDSKLYVYMPSDATAKAYDTWEDAEADFAIWDEDTTETSETA